MTLMDEPLTIRQEREADFDTIRTIVKESFAEAEHTDVDEYRLIDRLRKTDDYIPELSLVAEINGKIVGHIMFSRIHIDNAEALALAPLAVHPEYQHRGIGKTLIRVGHHIAKKMGYCCSVVLGAPEYYTKSGYLTASSFGITAPFDIPPQFYMVYRLSSCIPQGKVRYSDAFGL